MDQILYIKNLMQMKNGENWEVMWEIKSWITKESHTEIITKELLKCKRIIRNVNFSSNEKIDELELVQNFYLMWNYLKVQNLNLDL